MLVVLDLQVWDPKLDFWEGGVCMCVCVVCVYVFICCLV
jgi:hypothetical protein